MSTWDVTYFPQDKMPFKYTLTPYVKFDRLAHRLYMQFWYPNLEVIFVGKKICVDWDCPTVQLIYGGNVISTQLTLAEISDMIFL